jgi:hypothetical protein
MCAIMRDRCLPRPPRASSRASPHGTFSPSGQETLFFFSQEPCGLSFALVCCAELSAARAFTPRAALESKEET